jgi:adenosyl cobinamide kinase/adenosyl cobinamide phosphate guanylyltransferase
MTEDEKMAERLEERGKRTPRIWATSDLYYEAAALIRRLQAENEALRVKQAGLVEALMPLVDAAHGLSFGTDWNNGTQAKLHGHRQKLIDAVPRARAAIEVNHE